MARKISKLIRKSQAMESRSFVNRVSQLGFLGGPIYNVLNAVMEVRVSPKRAICAARAAWPLHRVQGALSKTSHFS
jgi:hypothetical protein